MRETHASEVPPDPVAALHVPPGGGKRRKGDPQPVIDTATKPIKWKKIINKELESCGGQMGLKALREACVAEVSAFA